MSLATPHKRPSPAASHNPCLGSYRVTQCRLPASKSFIARARKSGAFFGPGTLSIHAHPIPSRTPNGRRRPRCLSSISQSVVAPSTHSFHFNSIYSTNCVVHKSLPSHIILQDLSETSFVAVIRSNLNWYGTSRPDRRYGNGLRGRRMECCERGFRQTRKPTRRGCREATKCLERSAPEEPRNPR